MAESAPPDCGGGATATAGRGCGAAAATTAGARAAAAGVAAGAGAAAGAAATTAGAAAAGAAATAGAEAGLLSLRWPRSSTWNSSTMATASGRLISPSWRVCWRLNTAGAPSLPE